MSIFKVFGPRPRVLVLTLLLLFAAGYMVGKLHVVHMISASGYDYDISLPTDDAGVTGQRDFRELTVEPVRLAKEDLEETRRAMEHRIFGGPRISPVLSTRDVDAQRLQSHYTGAKVFDRYYQDFLREKSVSVQEIIGEFPEIERFRWRSLYIRQVKNGNNRLFLYHQGHSGNPFAMKFSNAVISGLIARGYDLIIFSMPGTGWNKTENVRIKTWDGWGYLLQGHKFHEFLEMIDTGQAHFIKFFLEPVLASTDHALRAQSYQKILMAGISGGGWTTTLASALDERIDVSLSFAGGLPFFARNEPRDLGDAEQVDHSFYRDFPYTILYELASASNRKKRLHYQIFSADDPCCFAGRSAAGLEQYFRTRPQPAEWDFRIAIVENDTHEIVPQYFFDLLDKLGSPTTQ